MEPLWVFSAADQSIDIVGGVIYAWVAFKAIRRLIINNINTPGKILLASIAIISLLHILQVSIQLIYGGPLGQITFRIWDFINYFTAILFLMGVERIQIREKLNH